MEAVAQTADETPPASESGRKIVLATLGSLGDLHPFVAIAKALQARGHRPTLATSELYREWVERQGIGFHAMRPDFLGIDSDPEVFRKGMDRKGGTEYVLRNLFIPPLRESYEDLAGALKGADLLVTHTVVFAGPMAAGVAGTPWITAVLAPIAMMSVHDPSIPPQHLWVKHCRRLGPKFFGALVNLAKRSIRSWSDPIHEFRRELGLAPAGDPIFEGAHSPHGVLALFSSLLGSPQADWPDRTVQTGFSFFDDLKATGMPADLADFLDAGPAPVVFTLGSSAVMDAGKFYEESAAAARALGMRAVLLIGRDSRNQPRDPLPDGMIALEYAPYSELFPRAAAIVHQGGVGTTGQAMRAGRPMVIVPWGHDQPDNAERIRRLGIGLTIDRQRYSAQSATWALRAILSDRSFAMRAVEVGNHVRSETGAEGACNAIEKFMALAGR
jgi:UDP:flavonoid glycosyltransferase YjiC (YdhE family)